MKRLLLPFLLLTGGVMFAAESNPTIAATAINSLGIDLLRAAGKPDANFLLSPYSIQSAMAMSYAGADGKTREEMAQALHFSSDEAALHSSFAALQRDLDSLMQQTAKTAEQAKKYGSPMDPLVVTVANRLFGQAGFTFREPFLVFVADHYGAPLEPLDFAKDAAGATRRINGWVEEQTRDRIRNLVPDGALDQMTKLVLVNAIYLKAPWAEEFPEGGTHPRSFHIAGREAMDVPMMTSKRRLAYIKREGMTVVAIPYIGRDLQFLILLPDKVGGLATLESQLTPALLAECAQAPANEVILFLPKFKLEPPMIPLGGQLQKLGMKSAFDHPAGSANFDRMAPRQAQNYLYISEVFHKTFLQLDEKGTEAAAATAVAMRTASIAVEKPPEVRVDRPFLFAIQHRPSGACLFIGRVTDPR